MRRSLCVHLASVETSVGIQVKFQLSKLLEMKTDVKLREENHNRDQPRMSSKEENMAKIYLQ